MSGDKLDPLAEIDRRIAEIDRYAASAEAVGNEMYHAGRKREADNIRHFVLRPYVEAVEELRNKATTMRAEMDILDQAAELYPRPRAALWDAASALHTALARFEKPPATEPPEPDESAGYCAEPECMAQATYGSFCEEHAGLKNLDPPAMPGEYLVGGPDDPADERVE